MCNCHASVILLIRQGRRFEEVTLSCLICISSILCNIFHGLALTLYGTGVCNCAEIIKIKEKNDRNKMDIGFYKVGLILVSLLFAVRCSGLSITLFD